MRHKIKQRIQYNPGETFYLKPFFDIHWGSTACDKAAFKRDLAATDDYTFLFFGGDLLDAIVVTDPRYRKSGDDTKSDAIINNITNEMVAVLKPYTHRIIAIGKGNHEDNLTKKSGFDIIKEICRRLKVPDAGYSGLFKMIFSYKGGRGRTVTVRYHHGWGGGSRTQGADLTKFSKDLTYWDADLFLYGHVHRKQTDEVERMGLCGDELISKPKVLCICGTYLKTYTNSVQPTYSEKCGYPPVAIGGVRVSIKPIDKWVKMKAFLD